MNKSGHKGLVLTNQATEMKEVCYGTTYAIVQLKVRYPKMRWNGVHSMARSKGDGQTMETTLGASASHL
jgi:hypothetical protein